MSDELIIEAVRQQWARSAARFSGETPEDALATFDAMSDEQKGQFRELIIDFLRAIEGAGYKVVGREATEEMLDAMVTADHGGTLGKRSSNEWQAAFDAAPTVGGGE